MAKNTPLSFKLFLITLGLSLAALSYAFLPSRYNGSGDHAFTILFCLSGLCFILSISGIITGLRNNSEEQKVVILNRIGWIGGFLLLGAIIYASLFLVFAKLMLENL